MNFEHMKVQIISIGNELLNGDTINTNASWLGDYMTSMGFEVTEVHTISDELEVIKKTLSRSMSESDLVLCTGGLGPTHDDITKAAVAELFQVQLQQNEDVLSFVQEIFKKRKIPFSNSNYAQAEVPENCEVLFNKMGTAPGMWFHEEDCFMAVMPGVPYEMKYLMKEEVSPKLKAHFDQLRVVHSRYIQTAGVGESTLSDEVLGDVTSFLNNGVSLAFLPKPGGVTLRLTATAQTQNEAEQKLDALASQIYAKAKNYVVGEGKYFTLAEAVGELLKQQNLKIATAESCTGGMIANELTNIAGSSSYMLGGIVAYANEVKINSLGVSSSDIESVGAVSKVVALAMAKGVAEKLEADIGISTTGIAGPGGGTKEKPVGTVWIGYWDQKQHFALHVEFGKDRLINKERSTRTALEMVRRVLMKIDEMPYNLSKNLA